MVSDAGDGVYAAFPWVALILSLVAFYAGIRRYRREGKATIDFWITLVVAVYLVIDGIFDFVPTLPKWLRLSVHVLFVLCFIALLWMQKSEAKHNALR